MRGRIIAFLFCILSVAASAAAQQAAGAKLSGLVSDPQGLPVEGVSVQVTNQETATRRRTETNAEGFFSVSYLPAGLYSVEFQAPGFGPLKFTGLQLLVGQSRRLDAGLELASPAENVIVSGDTLGLVNQTTSEVNGVIDSEWISSLPLNGRNFLELALLLPGNAPAAQFDPTKANTVLISSAGQFGRGGSVTIDGADNNDDVVGGSLLNLSQEAVQEFQVITNRFSAAQGRSGSSVLNVVTKSGGNDVHGSASFFLRDDSLQGLPATFSRSAGEPPFDRQQYALAVGGPIRKDRAWWFGALEYRNQDGALLVGRRNLETRTIERDFAPAPLNDIMSLAKVDWNPSPLDQISGEYLFQDLDAVAASSLIRAIGSESQRQQGDNRFHAGRLAWTRTLSPFLVNNFSFSVNNFFNATDPVAAAPQLTFPSIQDGASFRTPQKTRQNRFQLSDTVNWVRGAHSLSLGGEFQRIDAEFDLDVFRQGRIELLEDFPAFDRNGDGLVNDDDLLFSVTLRSAFPERSLFLPDTDNTHLAFFVQDDWRLHPRFTLNLGLRYELDTDVKNVSRYDEINPLVRPFLSGSRGRDSNNWAPRIGFNWASANGRRSLHAGYGIYYDRVVLQVQSLERGLDGRALPIEVRAGNAFFVDPSTGTFPSFAPTLSNPFSGFVLPGAGAGGINIIDNSLQNPMIQQANLGIQQQFGRDFVLRLDYLHNFGTHFIIGRTIGEVNNPVIGGPDFVVNLESSVQTKYDGLLVSLERRFNSNMQFRASYTLSKAFNYANDDQIPFSEGPIDPDNLRLEYGPAPNDQRHRFNFHGQFGLPARFNLSLLWTMASGVPTDILLPDGTRRIPTLQRNAGGRLFHSGADLNAFISQVNAGGGIDGVPLPLVDPSVRLSDSFHSADIRISREFSLGEWTFLPTLEVFNLFNVTNVLGVSNVNYSGFSNALVRDSADPQDPGFLRSSSFGRPVTTAGGVFGSGGARAFQLALRVLF
ncbi:MAG TPA: TonB-dependent receptor [Acidobacteriota bacterium]|nr:TonB-dependent receptor [Acidobacteriota bacterium]